MRLHPRLVLALLLAGALAPGLWWRSALPPADYAAPVEVRQLAIEQGRVGAFEFGGAWQLTSRNDNFGGYSALVALSDHELLMASDKGRTLRLPLPPRGVPGSKTAIFDPANKNDKHLNDIEGLAVDQASGTVWAALEHSNTVVRERRDGKLEGTSPAAMRDWPTERGAEAFERLVDGRFLALSESRDPDGTHPGLLFPRDPLEGGAPTRFRFAGLEDYRPTGLTALPDGRVLVLMREVHWGLPPRFTAAILLVDPARIEKGGLWRGKLLARLEQPFPLDNYEGIAAIPQADGKVAVWIVSDDNMMRAQRTLLVKLVWSANEKARGNPARPVVNQP